MREGLSNLIEIKSSKSSLKDIVNFQTQKTWTGQNPMRCYNMNALPHMLLHILPKFLFEICLLLDC